MHALTSDGVAIAYRCHGGMGPKLLLAHATGFCGDSWRPVANALVGHFEVWSLDFRGHGASDRPSDGRFDWDGTALDVLAVIDAIATRQTDADPPAGSWVGAGHSMGGAALLLAQQARPSAFRALWLFEPIVMPPAFAAHDAENRMAAQARRRRPGFASRAEARANYASKPPMASFHPDALDGYLDGGLRTAPDGAVELSCAPADEAEVFSMGARHRAWGHLLEVVVPVTVVAGSTDGFGPAHFAEPISAALGNGSLESHPELGHFGPFERPGVIAGSIQRAFGDPPGLSVLDRTIAP